MTVRADLSTSAHQKGRSAALLFRVARESFAAPLAEVEEAVDFETLHDLPGATGALRGVILLREALVPAYLPSVALGVDPQEATTALVLERGGTRMAMLVDDVDDVISLEESELVSAPGGNAAAGVVRGVVRHGARLVALVDVDAMVAALRGGEEPEDE